MPLTCAHARDPTSKRGVLKTECFAKNQVGL
jgi:hypothetical protein